MKTPVPVSPYSLNISASTAKMGSRSVSQTSKRFMPRPGLHGFHKAWVLRTTHHPAWSLTSTPRILSLRADWPIAPAFPRLQLHPPLKRPHASGPRPIPDAAASHGPQRSASPVLDDHGGFFSNPTGVQQLLRQDQPEALARFFNLRLHDGKLPNRAPQSKGVFPDHS